MTSKVYLSFEISKVGVRLMDLPILIGLFSLTFTPGICHFTKLVKQTRATSIFSKMVQLPIARNMLLKSLMSRACLPIFSLGHRALPI